ncbi:YigZ family protein [Candidatus Sulfidibacterium hydrothermale]|uniref:YigZ family protein n=1 Tax=Candidatus Sulfidibacterium hydrothermale TaxID=2875962 RepID=UPI001F0A19AA|nr:YigZ family protein [Candidatus Sulfidibacterium hydrothermale]UBM62896.1 YigZ family protein [Candidatus Sulfidibacterium hydrothermale]
MSSDHYKTIKGTSQGIYKEKGSKFIALAFHTETEQEAKQQLTAVKKEYHDARHHCYAFRINPENEFFRSSDDGEPSGTAGKPILNQIFSEELFNVLVVVVRYFGGTKLGVSGLIRAYKTATREALQNAKIITSTITRTIELEFEYPLMNPVMRIVKEEHIKVLKQDFNMRCKLILQVERNQEKKLVEKFKTVTGLTVK